MSTTVTVTGAKISTTTLDEYNKALADIEAAPVATNIVTDQANLSFTFDYTVTN